jgi:hypothetical protein
LVQDLCGLALQCGNEFSSHAGETKVALRVKATVVCALTSKCFSRAYLEEPIIVRGLMGRERQQRSTG